MPLRLRRIIFWAFVTCFLIVAPVLALYSMGYRYHVGKHRIERTGLIAIDGKPSDAVVRIDGIVRARGLPARIGGVRPNEYAVRVERTGFHPWERRLSVASGRTTFAERIVLFRDATASLEASGNLGGFTVSADRRWAAFTRDAVGGSEVWVLDLHRGSRTLALRVPLTERPRSVPLTWSPRGARLLVRIARTDGAIDAYAIDPTTPNRMLAVHRRSPKRLTDVAWELDTETMLTARSDGRLHRIHAVSGRVTPIAIRAPAMPLTIHRNIAYAIDAGAIIAIPTDGGPPTSVAVLPAGVTIASFTELQGTMLVAETTLPRSTLMVSTTAGTTIVRPGYAVGRSSSDGATLWRTDTELWADDDAAPAVTSTPHLLGRYAVALVDATWHPHGDHVIAMTATEIFAVERRDAADAVRTTLAAFDRTTALAVDPNGERLWVIARRGREVGLWSLPLR